MVLSDNEPVDDGQSIPCKEIKLLNIAAKKVALHKEKIAAKTAALKENIFKI